MRLFLLVICLALGSSATFAQEEGGPAKDLKQLGAERTVQYNAALKRWAADKLIPRLMAEEATFGEKAKEQEAAGNKEMAALLNKAKTAKHMEKRYYLRLLDKEFNHACQAFDDADPAFIGTRTGQP